MKNNSRARKSRDTATLKIASDTIDLNFISVQGLHRASEKYTCTAYGTSLDCNFIYSLRHHIVLDLISVQGLLRASEKYMYCTWYISGLQLHM